MPPTVTDYREHHQISDVRPWPFLVLALKSKALALLSPALLTSLLNAVGIHTNNPNNPDTVIWLDMVFEAMRKPVIVQAQHVLSGIKPSGHVTSFGYCYIRHICRYYVVDRCMPVRAYCIMLMWVMRLAAGNRGGVTARGRATGFLRFQPYNR